MDAEKHGDQTLASRDRFRTGPGISFRPREGLRIVHLFANEAAQATDRSGTSGLDKPARSDRPSRSHFLSSSKRSRDVRFTPKSRHRQAASACPKSAIGDSATAIKHDKIDRQTEESLGRHEGALEARLAVCCSRRIRVYRDSICCPVLDALNRLVTRALVAAPNGLMMPTFASASYTF